MPHNPPHGRVSPLCYLLAFPPHRMNPIARDRRAREHAQRMERTPRKAARAAKEAFENQETTTFGSDDDGETDSNDEEGEEEAEEEQPLVQELSEYELQRQRNMAENHSKLQMLGLAKPHGKTSTPPRPSPLGAPSAGASSSGAASSRKRKSTADPDADPSSEEDEDEEDEEEVDEDAEFEEDAASSSTAPTPRARNVEKRRLALALPPLAPHPSTPQSRGVLTACSFNGRPLGHRGATARTPERLSLDDEQRRKAAALFRALDGQAPAGAGAAAEPPPTQLLGLAELGRCVAGLGLELADHDVRDMIEYFSTSGGGGLSFDDFLRMVQQLPANVLDVGS